MSTKNNLLIYVAGSPSYARPFHELGDVTYDENDLSGCDLVVFTGGEDVNPELYGETKHPYTSFNKQRDNFEKRIFEKTAFYKIPMVGICRGLQFFHVMNGGKLIQHLENHPSGNHQMVTEDGDVVMVNTLHHQACIRDDSIMDILGMSHPDGAVEAAYHPNTRCFGVQWHPEMLPHYSKAYKWFMQKVKEHLNLIDDEPTKEVSSGTIN